MRFNFSGRHSESIHAYSRFLLAAYREYNGDVLTSVQPKIILYCGFAPVADPEAGKLWQNTLCESLNLTGRILISRHGINGTLGGTVKDCNK